MGRGACGMGRGACGMLGGEGQRLQDSGGTLEGKRLLGKHRHRRWDSMKVDLKEVGCRGVDWIHLAQGRETWQAVVNTVMNLQVP